jgi:putative endonuclease
MTHHVYLLRGGNGRHYIGQTADLERRLEEHRRGKTHTTRRLGGELQLIASRGVPSREEAVALERRLKSWKDPAKVEAWLRSA